MSIWRLVITAEADFSPLPAHGAGSPPYWNVITLCALTIGMHEVDKAVSKFYFRARWRLYDRATMRHCYPEDRIFAVNGKIIAARSMRTQLVTTI